MSCITMEWCNVALLGFYAISTDYRHCIAMLYIFVFFMLAVIRIVKRGNHPGTYFFVTIHFSYCTRPIARRDSTNS